MKTTILRFPLLGIGVVAMLVKLSAQLSTARAQYNYTTLNEPIGTATYALGISGTNIVGHYSYQGHQLAFLYNGTSYIPLTVPGATDSSANGIDGTNIVGSANGQGFLFNGTSYTSFSVPGANSTTATGISGTNIVGYYEDLSYYYHGFLYRGGSYTYLNVPGAADTFAWGISGTNIVGYFDYVSGGVCHGFLYNGSGYNTNVSVPGATWGTYACGISGTNIVGYYNDASYNTHGFLYDGSSYNTNFNVSGTTFTEVWGISGNNLVGFFSYSSAMYAHGFLATPAAPIGPPPLIITGAHRLAGAVALNLIWTNNGSQCVLTGAGALTGSWSTVSTPWTTNAGWVSTAVTNSGPAQFYRLQQN